MGYVEQLVADLEDRLPWGNTDPAERHLLSCFYALLALTASDRIDAKRVHDAWVCGMAALGRSHPSMVPYEMLEPSTRAKDEPFAAALVSSAAALRTPQED
jgi:hypothetical protein